MRLVSLAAVCAALPALTGGGLRAAAEPGGQACSNLIVGTPAADTLEGTAAGDQIKGRAGDDGLRGAAGDDCLYGGSGDDSAWGGIGRDQLTGNSGDDQLDGEAGADILSGGDGGDQLEGGGGRDILQGGSGRDRIGAVGYGYTPGWKPSPEPNRVDAGPGDDSIDAANGHTDRILCGSGRDVVRIDRDDVLSGCERRQRLASPLPGAAPRSGSRTRSFVISFRSLKSLDPHGEFFSIRVQGPTGSACRRIVGNSVDVAYRRDGVVRYRVRPFKGFGSPARRWCRGLYHGRASFMRTLGDSCGIQPSAAPAPACFAEIRLGQFSFRVR